MNAQKDGAKAGTAMIKTGMLLVFQLLLRRADRAPAATALALRSEVWLSRFLTDCDKGEMPEIRPRYQIVDVAGRFLHTRPRCCVVLRI